jgi:hypothetical protein
LIEGKGQKSGGTELITSDRLIQCEMATKALETIDALKYIFVHGTPYHTGNEEDFESIIAEKFGADIGGHEWIEVNGKIFDVKHKIGSSGIPHGRYTALAKEKLWNLYWNEIKGAPKSDIFIRAHVHYFNYIGNDTFFGVILPALQTFGSKYGNFVRIIFPEKLKLSEFILSFYMNQILSIKMLRLVKYQKIKYKII